MVITTMMEKLVAVTLSFMAIFAVSASSAQISSSNHVETKLVSNVLEIPAGGTFWIALRQKIRPNWHTYWKNPGDAGEPIRIEWNLPLGFEASEIYWPVPVRIPVGPLMNFGYKGEVFILTEITAPAALEDGRQFAVSAHAEWLVCEDICIPEEADLEISMRATTGEAQPDPVWAPDIEAARSALPRLAPWPTRVAMLNDEVVVSIEADDLVEIFRTERIEDVAFFPEEDGIVRNAAPQTVRYGRAGFSVSVEAGHKVAGIGGISPFDPVRGIVVIRDREDRRDVGGSRVVAFELEATVGEIAAGTLTSQAAGLDAEDPPIPTAGVSFIEAFVFALVGGLILNLMPCVFPVLSMKAVGLVQAAQENPNTVRTSGLAYGAGVVSSFIGIALLLILFRAAGEEIGWGFQLQSPEFVTLMAYLMFLVGLNLSGVFEVGRPLVSIVGRETPSGGAIGSFGTGVLATAVATPCTAPFMGTATGFALTQTPALCLSIFTALGLGMALPYVALSFLPGLAAILPRPGVWMERFRQLLAFPMYATVVWLIWVLSQQTGSTGVLVALTGLVLLGFASWLFDEIRNVGSAWRYVGALIALLGIFAALAVIGYQTVDTSEIEVAARPPMAQTLTPEPFSDHRLKELRADGRAVFVNFTAAWCITCLVNERVALNGSKLAERFKQDNVAYLKGDWTNRDPEITRALARHGRNGVPLYLMYAPGTSVDEATVLPQILTEATVLSALDDMKAVRRPASRAGLALPRERRPSPDF